MGEVLQVSRGRVDRYTCGGLLVSLHRAQELCESRGGHPGLPVLMSLTVSVDVKQH